ncbi:hypothetical protein HK097_002248 [Rhizophlyctis rosea]|uniref:Catalase core domain-containing protein n=1 Tax=Rhizophlyctis rosea TaxID=64517 RepID=A0AAD5SH08_9FUNG|nr:hypothetical protein HK097_002248 [Rhizophlyctis rosea]
MSGEDPDFAKRDLWEHIDSEGTAEWKLCMQIMSIAEAASGKLAFNPFDLTKVWPHSEYPLVEVGKFVLNRNPENYHGDVEQTAFNPGSYVDGIEPSPDLLLNWRSFFYRDAQYHRLASANIHQIPVNCPFLAKYYSPASRDGNIRIDSNGGLDTHYQPHSYKSSPGPNLAQDQSPQPLMPWHQPVISRSSPFLHEEKESDYDQVRKLVTQVMKPEGKENLYRNTGLTLKLCTQPTIIRNYLAQCYAIAPEYAEGIL